MPGVFFGMLRPGNFLCVSEFDSTKNMVIGDVASFQSGFRIALKWTKTLQFREKILYVYLPTIAQHPLNPTAAMKDLLALHQGQHKEHPLFCDNSGFALKYATFLAVVRHVFQTAGIPEEFS